MALHEIHINIWRGIEDKSQLKGLMAKLRPVLRLLLAYPVLIWRLIVISPRPDLILIGYPGFLDAVFASIIGRCRRIPVVWDVFISVYDTVVEDRGLLSRSGLAASVLWWIERTALRLTSLAFMDTKAHARRLESLFRLPPHSCGAVWVGVEFDRFPASAPPRSLDLDRPMRVLFYGQFIPLHGIPIIIETARRLRSLPIAWTIIGRGQEASRIQTMLDRDPLPAVRWIDWVDYHHLAEWIARSDLCLGIFGTSAKAASVIPNKVFQIISAGKPLITRDSPATRELLQDDPPCTYLVPPGDPDALESAIRQHFETHRKSPPKSCHGSLASRIGPVAIGAQFRTMLVERLART